MLAFRRARLVSRFIASHPRLSRTLGSTRSLARRYSQIPSMINEIPDTPSRELPEHAVISTFDLFSIGGVFQLSVMLISLVDLY